MLTFKSLLKTTSLLLLLLFFSISYAQDYKKIKFGNGIKYTAKDSSFYMKFSTRMQTMYEGMYQEGAKEEFTNQFSLRRARFKFDGYAFSPKIVYKIEYDVVNSQMLDAVIKWNFAKGFNLWVGQTKLPSNRERVVSSQNLQFVDRSNLNARFNIDRDKGVQLRHKFNIGTVFFEEIASVAIGEGRLYTGTSVGNDYTGRIEILPLGEFSNKGDYFCSDLDREPKPKLALGYSYDFNQNAVNQRGQLGNKMSINRDLEGSFADLMFKYRGFSLMSEYAVKRSTNGNPEVRDTLGKVVESFFTGKAFNAQMGYLFKSNWEIAARYTTVKPEARTGNKDNDEYTLGISRYISGHNLKVQSDFSLNQQPGRNDRYIFRMQVEMSF